MKQLLSLAVLGSALVFGNAFAADSAKPAASAAAKPAASAPMAAASGEKAMTKQQSKMGDCNAEAKEKNLKGDERKKFMSSCLKGATEAQKAQQDKMKSCN